MTDIIKDEYQELIQCQAELEEKLARKTAEASKYKDGYHTIMLFVLVILFVFAFLKFRDFEITVNADSREVVAVSTSWWGIKTIEREIRWMRTDQYDFAGWMTKGIDGDWYLYIVDDNGPSPYE